MNKANNEISKDESFGGAELLLFGLKYPGREKESGFYWINHYKPESITEGKSGRAGRVKVSAFPGQPLVLVTLGVGFLISTVLVLTRARGAGAEPAPTAT